MDIKICDIYPAYCHPYATTFLAMAVRDLNSPMAVDPASAALYSHSFQVMLKTPRYVPESPLNTHVTSLLQELAAIWSSLQHPNIPPFLGLYTMPDGQPAIITPFYENGCILEYISSTPGINKSILLKGVADGITYLHGQGVVHGSIKPGNIVIDSNGTPRLCDAAFYFRIHELTYPNRTFVPDAWAYKPGEELMPLSTFRPTMEMDVYAFGSVAYEVLSGKPPFPGGIYTYRGLQKIIDHGHITLAKPPMLDNRYWGIIQKCWARDPVARPTMAEVVCDLSCADV